MFLKKCVLALIVINLGYFAYSQGWLSQLLGGDASQREPERMSRQVNPSAIDVAMLSSTASATPSLVSTPLGIEPAAPAQDACLKHEQWIVYMGPYDTQALLDKKKNELKVLKLANKPVSKPSLKLGLSLGQFETEVSAREAMTALSKKGVKTASVLLWATTDCP